MALVDNVPDVLRMKLLILVRGLAAQPLFLVLMAAPLTLAQQAAVQAFVHLVSQILVRV